jgi:putative ABC transport system ATP-binding protein
MIEIRDLEFQYGDSADAGQPAFRLYVEAFSVARNSRTALVGPSGSGKTTLLGLIAGTLRPARGRIAIGDQTITALGDRELGRFRIRRIGQVFQAFELLEYLTVLENVMLPWYVVGEGSKSEAVARAGELLENVGLGRKSRSRPGQLSQGEQQRVAVCRAMFNQPQVLLADEPTGNLDTVNKQHVVDLLCEQAQSHGSTLLMVTHDESLLDRFDTVLEMSDFARHVGNVAEA